MQLNRYLSKFGRTLHQRESLRILIMNYILCALVEVEGKTMHVSLTPELEKLVKTQVESGLYNSSSEVVREALRLWSEQQ